MDPRTEAIESMRGLIVRELETISISAYDGDPIEPFEVMSYIPESYGDEFVKVECDLISGEISIESFHLVSRALIGMLQRQLTDDRIGTILRRVAR